jgi:hypothetical protein
MGNQPIGNERSLTRPSAPGLLWSALAESGDLRASRAELPRRKSRRDTREDSLQTLPLRARWACPDARRAAEYPFGAALHVTH